MDDRSEMDERHRRQLRDYETASRQAAMDASDPVGLAAELDLMEVPPALFHGGSIVARKRLCIFWRGSPGTMEPHP